MCLSRAWAYVMTIGYTHFGNVRKEYQGAEGRGPEHDRHVFAGQASSYVGNFFIFLGIALFIEVWWFVLLSVLAYWMYYERIIIAEEEFLRGKLERLFVEWAQRTPLIIPKFKNWKTRIAVFPEEDTQGRL